MSRAYDHWIHQREEPGDIVRGNHKRFKPSPAFIEKAKGMERMRQELGDEEYFKRIREEQQKFERNKEYNQ